MEEKKPTKEDTARVKGLGCLRDKRYDDVFNVRVITGYGKLDTAGMRAISDAAERFGTGEVALTTRQTVEIQGVRYDRLDELFAFLGENGLSTGGTGAKVRPDLRTSVIFFSTSSLNRSIRSDGSDRLIFSPVV